MDTTTGKPTARCLDLTRLVSRVGRGPWTGIDRVEFQYFQTLEADKIPLFALVRMYGGYAILDPAGVRKLLRRISGPASWDRLKTMGWLTRNPKLTHLRELTAVRSYSSSWVKRGRLAQHLPGKVPAQTKYLNVGHSNISPEVFEAFRGVQDCRTSLMLHDTIPLDFPQFQRPETVSKFAEKLELVGNNSNLIICNSDQTKLDVLRHLGTNKRSPNIVVAHLGVNVADPVPAELPPDIDLTRPYFATLGTIEPRKNHIFLLDIWQRLTEKPGAPHLYIVGQRGWNNQAVFDRLDQRPRSVTELSNLTDGAVTALLLCARGLLFPSLAEGFGLPAAEAAKLGVPVICNQLPVFTEVLGEYPIYADASDMYDWEAKIKTLAETGGKKEIGECSSRQTVKIPTWDEHFNLVLRLT